MVSINSSTSEIRRATAKDDFFGSVPVASKAGELTAQRGL
ncbi:unnamed protein product [Musa acuminata var. zebrina]